MGSWGNKTKVQNQERRFSLSNSIQVQVQGTLTGISLPLFHSPALIPPPRPSCSPDKCTTEDPRRDGHHGEVRRLLQEDGGDETVRSLHGGQVLHQGLPGRRLEDAQAGLLPRTHGREHRRGTGRIRRLCYSLALTVGKAAGGFGAEAVRVFAPVAFQGRAPCLPEVL